MVTGTLRVPRTCENQPELTQKFSKADTEKQEASPQLSSQHPY